MSCHRKAIRNRDQREFSEAINQTNKATKDISEPAKWLTVSLYTQKRSLGTSREDIEGRMIDLNIEGRKIELNIVG